MPNIEIVDGLLDPWTLEGTDTDKPNKIVLFNLAVGQLAQLGANYGNTIKLQAEVLREITDSVNLVQGRISDVLQRLEKWPDESFSFNIPSAAVNYSPPYLTKLSAADASLVEKLVGVPIAYQELGIYFDTPVNSPLYFSFSLANGTEIKSVSKGIVDGSVAGVIPDLQPYFPASGSPPVIDRSTVKVNYQGNTYTLSQAAMHYFVIPTSQAELDGYTTSIKLSGAWDNFSILLDDTQLLPLSTDPPTTNPNDTITFAIDPGIPDAFTFTRNSDAGTPGAGMLMFFASPPTTIPKFDPATSKDEMVYFEQVDPETKKYFFYDKILKKNASGAIVEERVKVYGTVTGFTYKPTDPQKADWTAQYSDKIVGLTQRGGDQTVFLNMLTQRYNYFFEAATNIIKAFASMFSLLANNI